MPYVVVILGFLMLAAGIAMSNSIFGRGGNGTNVAVSTTPALETAPPVSTAASIATTTTVTPDYQGVSHLRTRHPGHPLRIR